MSLVHAMELFLQQKCGEIKKEFVIPSNYNVSFYFHSGFAIWLIQN